jgi:RimJ/RimL family protein N-acetyltransferase
MEYRVRQGEGVHRIVEGEHVRLRPASWGFSEAELRRRYQWSKDDELQYWSGSLPGGRSLANFKETVGQRDWPRDGRRISYAILTHDNDLIGMISLYNIDRNQAMGEMGVYIGDKGLWGRGHGTDAIVSFLRHLFADLAIDSVYLHTYESNVRARKSYERVGFETDSLRRRYSPRIGYHDEVRMSITKERFARLHGLPAEAVPS